MNQRVIYTVIDDDGDRIYSDKNLWVELEGVEVDTYVHAGENFETALTALIEHHGADALTSLAAVMRHYQLELSGGIDSYVFIEQVDNMRLLHEGQIITANDIKPEK